MFYKNNSIVEKSRNENVGGSLSETNDEEKTIGIDLTNQF